MNTILTASANKIGTDYPMKMVPSPFCFQNKHLSVKAMVTFSVIVFCLDHSVMMRETWEQRLEHQIFLF